MSHPRIVLRKVIAYLNRHGVPLKRYRDYFENSALITLGLHGEMK